MSQEQEVRDQLIAQFTEWMNGTPDNAAGFVVKTHLEQRQPNPGTPPVVVRVYTMHIETVVAHAVVQQQDTTRIVAPTSVPPNIRG